MEALSTTITQTATSVVNNIVSGITDIFKTMFLPGDNYFTEKIKPIEEKFGFVSQFVSLVKDIIDMCSSEYVTPPSFTFDLSTMNTKYSMGDSVTIDFNWYAPYRDDINKFISGFMWLGFIWNTFKELPSIINGGASAIDTAEKIGGQK